MSQLTIRHIEHGKITVSDLIDDINAARSKGLTFAFTPDTLESVVNSLVAILREFNGIPQKELTNTEKNILSILLNGS